MGINKGLARLIRDRSSSHSSVDAQGLRVDDGIIEDVFGRSPPNSNSSNNNGDPLKKSKTLEQLEPKILENIFEYLKEKDLKSIRLLYNKRVCVAATAVFRNIHTFVRFDSDSKIFKFTQDMAKHFDFPFSRFRFLVAHIPRFILVTFTRAHNNHLSHVRIDTDEEARRGVDSLDSPPVQRLIWKLVGMIQELTEVEELEITFPSMSSFDYKNLEFEKNFDLEKLKILSITFSKYGFSKFSSNLTLEIMRNSENLQKFKVRLPEPVDSKVEAMELSRVLCACPDVPNIGIRLSVTSNNNTLLTTISNIVSTRQNRRIKHLELYLGPRCTSYQGVERLLGVAHDILVSLRLMGPKVMYHHGEHSQGIAMSLPSMEFLRFLDIQSHRIPIRPFQQQQFPRLISLSLHLRFGQEMFYQDSCLHPLQKLKLIFHETSIMKVLIPEFRLKNLISTDLTRLELINPPPGHLTFMSNWGKGIETLIIFTPGAYGEDPTYPIENVLKQLRGVIQLRPAHLNNLTMLPNLRILSLKCPIDEVTARFLLDEMHSLWQLTIDDSKVSKKTIERMRYKHYIYISWSWSDEKPRYHL